MLAVSIYFFTHYYSTSNTLCDGFENPLSLPSPLQTENSPKKGTMSCSSWHPVASKKVSTM